MMNTYSEYSARVSRMGTISTVSRMIINKVNTVRRVSTTQYNHTAITLLTHNLSGSALVSSGSPQAVVVVV